jgi:hypothetical protein
MSLEKNTPIDILSTNTTTSLASSVLGSQDNHKIVVVREVNQLLSSYLNLSII